MALPIADARIYGDFAGLDALRKAARDHDPGALRQVAQAFESLFARMLIKSMRAAIGPDPIFGSDQEQAYQQMYDDQLSMQLTRGKGLGLADMLVRQLQRRGDAGAAPSVSAGAPDSSSASVPARASTRESAPAPTSAAPSVSAPASEPAPALGATSAPHAAPSPDTLPSRPSAPASKAQRTSFIRELWPQAQRAARQLGVAPQCVLAQAALETNWGRQIPQDAAGRSSNNLFGVKAGDSGGPAVAARTLEVEGGAPRATTARFRAYSSPAQCFQDYVALLQGSPRYAAALHTGGDVAAFASALQRGGYATDPDYARKVVAIAGELSSAMAQSAGVIAQPLPASPPPLKSSVAVPIATAADSAS